MKAKLFKTILADLELTQVGFARLFGISPRTARKYVAGESAIPTPTVKLLCLLWHGRIAIKDIEEAKP